MEDNLFQIHNELKNKIYHPLSYQSFYVSDPKLRHIHKAPIRDRVVHQAVYRVLYHIFDKHFIFDSFSCRNKKGTHRAVKRLSRFCKRESKNYQENIYCLKCDIKKFFDNIDHGIFRTLIKRKLDQEDVWIIDKIIDSFQANQNKGLPLGNVTSQLFANIYLNEFDQFIKRKLKVKYYLRYTDDFVIVNNNQNYLKNLVKSINKFLEYKLALQLHPEKQEIRKFRHGIDFLGYVVLPHYTVLRTKTKRRMFKKIKLNKEKLKQGMMTKKSFDQSLQSYCGILKHCEGYKLREDVLKLCQK
ncbi:MAG: reverse transcriptase/maturase family protein [bacterium]